MDLPGLMVLLGGFHLQDPNDLPFLVGYVILEVVVPLCNMWGFVF